jgi:hypothetical protein
MVYLGQGRTSLKPVITNIDTVKYWLRKKDEPMEKLTDKDYYTIPELVNKSKESGTNDKLQEKVKEITEKYQELLTKIELLEL